MTRAVMVLTHRFDPTADRVVEELNVRRTPVVRFDTAEFPAALTLEARIGPDPRWVGSLATSSRSLDLDRVAGVYHRRPTGFEVDPDLSADERAWALLEARMGFGGVLASIGPWLNHPHRLGEAEYKPWQLRCAIRHGLWIPRTMVTNDPVAARAFVGSMERAVYKPLAGGMVVEGEASRLLYTTLVDADECDRTISTTAHLFQEWVLKDHEVRVTVVDDQLFAARIDGESSAAVVDWRADYESVRYRRAEVPEAVRCGVHGLMAELGLRFGALDFVVDPAGRWWFLECNPNGQWAWIEDTTAMPIARAIADALRGAP